jgi:hypothetical protein
MDTNYGFLVTSARLKSQLSRIEGAKLPPHVTLTFDVWYVMIAPPAKTCDSTKHDRHCSSQSWVLHGHALGVAEELNLVVIGAA